MKAAQRGAITVNTTHSTAQSTSSRQALQRHQTTEREGATPFHCEPLLFCRHPPLRIVNRCCHRGTAAAAMTDHRGTRRGYTFFFFFRETVAAPATDTQTRSILALTEYGIPPGGFPARVLDRHFLRFIYCFSPSTICAMWCPARFQTMT